jgi:hypothetical protein
MFGFASGPFFVFPCLSTHLEPVHLRPVSEYVRDLIRKDKEQTEAARLEALRTELAVAFAAPDATYEPLTAEEVITRSGRKRQTP